MTNHKKIGNDHVKRVHECLIKAYSDKLQLNQSTLEGATAQRILEEFPNIVSVKNKFDKGYSDMSCDITLFDREGMSHGVNLFITSKKGRIQPKNLGARSFLSKYFLSPELQEKFNEYFNIELLNFYKNITGEVYTSNLKELRKQAKVQYPKFVEEIEEYKKIFLLSIRNICFELLAEEYNSGAEGMKHAFSELFMVDEFNIITRYDNNHNLYKIEEFNYELPEEDSFSIYKIGNYSVGISFSDVMLLMRFKFESSPTSSLKLATGFRDVNTLEDIKLFNSEKIVEFEKIISNLNYSNVDKIKQNSIGKCNEAITYCELLKLNPKIRQVNEQNFIEMITKYGKDVKRGTIEELKTVANEAASGLHKYLEVKYNSFIIESIELVPDNYLKNRLDTSDLELVLKVNGQYVVESVSLKAISKDSGKITSKNPGVKKILGKQYFDIGSIDDLVAETKERYQTGLIDHKQAQITISKEIGNNLDSASQEELKRGIISLLGDAIIMLVCYKINKYYIFEHGQIESNIDIIKDYPSEIQNTLMWNDSTEELSMRVKFSAGQSKGWSSLKLACEYKYSK